MKTILMFVAFACTLALPSGAVRARASEPHRIASLSMAPVGHPQLTFEGSTNKAFRSYFDVFHLETSTDLRAWAPLAVVVRTNAATNAVTFLDPTAADANSRFYRTGPDHILTPFLPPTGPHAVGTFSRMLTDASRTNRFGIRTNNSFMISFWYPAQPSRAAPAPYVDPLIAQRTAYWAGMSGNVVKAFVQFASPHAPVATAPERFPVILYSHGLGDQLGRAVRTENTDKAVQLASHGYVVVSVDHTDAYATVLPPDQLILGRNVWSFNFLPDRLKDVAFLLNHLAQLNADDPVFKSRLDLDRLGIMGWSFGGGTAAEACRLEDPLKAAVLLDPYLAAAPLLQQKGLSKPFLNMAGSPDINLINKCPTNAYQLSISGAAHETYTDNAWVVGPSAFTRRRAQAMNACLISFFNKHLLGVDDGLLENPSATHPDVVSFRKK